MSAPEGLRERIARALFTMGEEDHQGNSQFEHYEMAEWEADDIDDWGPRADRVIAALAGERTPEPEAWMVERENPGGDGWTKCWTEDQYVFPYIGDAEYVAEVYGRQHPNVRIVPLYRALAASGTPTEADDAAL